MRILLTSLILLLSNFLYCTEPTSQWKARFESATPGDFVVMEQDNTYALLLVRSMTPGILILEEIAIPQTQVDLHTIRWSEWVSRKAPGHTSWTRYRIDLEKGVLVDAFSYSQQGWLYLDETQQFLTQLISLSLTPLSKDQYRKIGPPPMNREEDRRAIWMPPMTVEGKKSAHPSLKVWKGAWPEDHTPLSGCTLEFYFAEGEKVLPFPYWIEIKSPHYTLKIRAVDSGRGLASPWP